MFEPLIVDRKLLGLQLRHERRFYFFGTRHVRREDLPSLFPLYKFCFLKQVHGRAVLPANPALIQEADAHFTREANLALVSQSADCVPILLSSEREICSIHAGWRGMAQNIIAAAKPFLAPLRLAAIGPHIQCASFEVGDDVADTLAQAAAGASQFRQSSAARGKSFFDLNALAHAQLNQAYGSQVLIANCPHDTKTNAEYHSFRRDRESTERQYSFVVIEE